MLLRIKREAMGTGFEVVVDADDERAGERAANYALDEIGRLDAQLSLYRADSELSYLNAHAPDGPVKVSPELFALLEASARIWDDTAGAFDVTVGPLLKCWGFFRGQGTVPPPEEIAGALARVGMQHVTLNRGDGTVWYDRSGVVVDLGGIAKGLAVGRAADLLRESGIERALVHGGHSTVYGVGAPPDEDGWPIGIRHPTRPDERIATVRLADGALSTSGSYEKFFEHEGRLYSHIMDPRTGWPTQGMLSATAITEAGMESDALSTAFFVMGKTRTREYCDLRPSSQALLVPEPVGDEEPAVVEIGTAP